MATSPSSWNPLPRRIRNLFSKNNSRHQTRMERKETTVKTEFRDGKKIVTTTTIVTTDLNPMNMGELQNGLFESMEIPMNQPTIEPKTKKPKSSFQKEALDRHNYYRALHGVPALEWCGKCTAKAQKHADHLAKTSTFSHSEDKGFGENLFTSMNSRGPVISANAAVDSWYEEINLMKNYTDPSPSNFGEVGHFTQLIWKNTTHVGMAYAVIGNYVYVVANYLPPGNVIGRFPDNVFPPSE